MTRKYSVVIEGQPGSYSGYVPELPAILVTGRSLEELDLRAAEAIRLFLEEASADASANSIRHEVEVELPA